jgi:hypothetical protein
MTAGAHTRPLGHGPSTDLGSVQSAERHRPLFLAAGSVDGDARPPPLVRAGRARCLNLDHGVRPVLGAPLARK